MGIVGAVLAGLAAHFACNGIPSLLLARRLLRVPRPGAS
jgi:hypothetical protein